jgi:putative transposase
MKSVFLHKSYNVTVLMYHLVLPAKYRRSVITQEVDKNLVECCSEIEKRYEITFLEIGTDKNHVHFLVQASPTYSPTKIVTIIKSITARYIFQKNPEVKKQLWGGEFWSDGYFASTVGKYSSENAISKYIQKQGQTNQYIQLNKQLPLF